MLTAEHISIQSEIHKTQPDLFIFIKNGQEFIKGSICLRSDDGKEMGRYSIEIEIPREYPRKMPVVKETGGKIPRIPDRHINKNDGSACVIHEEDWFLEFADKPKPSIVKFINTYVLNFFISQKYYEVKKEWIYGEWAHYTEGKVEYYLKKLDLVFYTGATLRDIADNYLLNFGLRDTDYCFCNNGLILKHCKKHFENLQLLQRKIPFSVLEKAVMSIKEYSLKEDK